MGVVRTAEDAAITVYEILKRIRGDYPGGWKRLARGYQKDTPPFIQPDDPNDLRRRIPPLGLREYWYPALPAKAVGRRKPVGLRLLGTNLAFFRDAKGEVQALWDYCPHRGVYLSWGECVWDGLLSCAYHGATFDGDGNCVEFITEGPDSKMPGRLKARKYPTVTLKDIVFVWMGEGEPTRPEEDLPPELFRDDLLVQFAWDYWPMNWMIALENIYDAHNAFWVHRNAIQMLMRRDGGRPRTPVGYRLKIVNNRAVRALYGNEQYYAGPDGKIPYQMYYPRAGRYWPIYRWRLLWTWLTDRDRRSAGTKIYENPEEWGGRGFSIVLPGMRRSQLGNVVGTRWCIPVEEDLTRIFYIRAMAPASKLARIWKQVSWPYDNWKSHFNFQNQDRDMVRTVQYQYPEFLSSTDSMVVMARKLIVEHGRGLQPPADLPAETLAEKFVREGDQLLGVDPSIHLIGVAKGGDGAGGNGASADVEAATGRTVGG